MSILFDVIGKAQEEDKEIRDWLVHATDCECKKDDKPRCCGGDQVGLRQRG